MFGLLIFFNPLPGFQTSFCFHLILIDKNHLQFYYVLIVNWCVQILFFSGYFSQIGTKIGLINRTVEIGISVQRHLVLKTINSLTASRNTGVICSIFMMMNFN